MLYGDISSRWFPRVVDGFEDNDLSEYPAKSLGFTTSTANVYEGNYSLEFNGSTTQVEACHSYKGDGLPQYPSAGDNFRVYFTLVDSVDKGRIQFGTQSGTGGWGSLANGYTLRFDEYNGIAKLQKKGGSPSDSFAYNGFSTEWHWWETSWGTDGTISATLYNSSGSQGSLSINDTTYKSGGIAFSIDYGDGFFDKFDIIK